MPQNPIEKLRSKIENVSETMSKKSNEIYAIFKNEIDPDAEKLGMEKVKGYLSFFTEKEKFDENISKIINSYNLTTKISKEQIKSEKDLNEKLSQQEFCDFVKGKEIKSNLFDKNLDQVRHKIEDLITLYTLMGGDKDGISIDNLNRCISKVLDLYSDPVAYLRDDYDPNTKKPDSQGEAQEIIEIFGKGKDRLTLEEFVNIMTSEFDGHFETLTIDNPLLNK